MALKLYDTLNPSGDFPLVEAKDVKMPDGSRLSELSVAPGIDEATEERIAAVEESTETALGGMLAVSMRVTELEKVAASVDLTSYESNGVIVETYSDGSTKTYTMEFNENGKPTKVTDSDGNVTVLTW